MDERPDCATINRNKQTWRVVPASRFAQQPRPLVPLESYSNIGRIVGSKNGRRVPSLNYCAGGKFFPLSSFCFESGQRRPRSTGKVFNKNVENHVEKGALAPLSVRTPQT